MVILTMHVCSGAKHSGIPPVHSKFKTWMIWGVIPEDRKQGIVYPSNERIAALAQEQRKGIDHTGVTIVFICHDGEGNYVLQKRSENARDEQGMWDCGGGGLELHDTVQSTLEDEIFQELGAKVLGQEFLGYRDVHRTNREGQKTHWIALDFKVLVHRNEVINGEPHKFDEIGWFTIDSLPSPMHSQWPIFFEKYKDKL